MTGKARDKASDADTHDAHADGGISDTWGHSALLANHARGFTFLQSVPAGPTLRSRFRNVAFGGNAMSRGYRFRRIAGVIQWT